MEITIKGRECSLRSPYSASLVAGIKRLPATDRKWDRQQRVWVFLVDHLDAVLQLISSLGYNAPQIIGQAENLAPSRPEVRLVQVLYIGAPKERSPGVFTAFGYLPDSTWGVTFTEEVLRAWFEPGMGGGSTPKGESTLYGILGVGEGVSGAEIKSAWRRLIRVWHPDVNRDDDAHEMTLRINKAYETLGNPLSRRKYDAGLLFQRSAENALDSRPDLTRWQKQWRPPLRCGNLLVESLMVLGRIQVERILEWKPILNAQGEELVASWPAGVTAPVFEWISF